MSQVQLGVGAIGAVLTVKVTPLVGLALVSVMLWGEGTAPPIA